MLSCDMSQRLHVDGRPTSSMVLIAFSKLWVLHSAASIPNSELGSASSFCISSLSFPCPSSFNTCRLSDSRSGCSWSSIQPATASSLFQLLRCGSFFPLCWSEFQTSYSDIDLPYRSPTPANKLSINWQTWKPSVVSPFDHFSAIHIAHIPFSF